MTTLTSMLPRTTGSDAPSVSPLRVLGAAGLLLAALVLQSAVLSQVSIGGVVPNLCLLVVLAAGAVRGREVGAVVGFFAGLALDLTPPADHVAGRWAFALAVVGYVAGEVVRSERFVIDPRNNYQAGAFAAAGSLVATLLFQVSGLLVHDGASTFMTAVGVLVVSLLLDAAVAVLALPWLVAVFRRWRPAQLAV